VRVATFNVLHGRGLSDGIVDLDRYADAVASLGADVVALQEVDRAQPRSHSADLVALAAERAGAGWHGFAPALTGLPGGWLPARAGDEGRPQYGVGMLVRGEVLSSRVVRLPALRGAHPIWFHGRRRPVLVRDEPRVALVVELPTMVVAATHLSYIPGWNLVQLRRLMGQLPRRGPLLLMGDLNAGPQPVTRASGLGALGLGVTYPLEAPTRQLDHVLGRGLRATSTEVRQLSMSDHRALVVELES
jgi:endonuclease/exonuclease/phosphatase family metal-dependent hydrolase